MITSVTTMASALDTLAVISIFADVTRPAPPLTPPHQQINQTL